MKVDLQRIEVIKGAASALFGGSALGGVLNIVSKSPHEESAMLANAKAQNSDSSIRARLNADHSDFATNMSAWAPVDGTRRFSLFIGRHSDPD